MGGEEELENVMSRADTIASVFNEDTGLYDYYRLKRPLGSPWTMVSSPIGTPVQDALPSLPWGSRHVGRGRRALGTVARTADIDWRKILETGAIATLAYFAGKQLGLWGRNDARR